MGGHVWWGACVVRGLCGGGHENIEYSQYCLMPRGDQGRGGLMFDVQGAWIDRARGLYSEVKCIMGNGDMGAPVNGQIWLKTLPSRNFVGEQ